jgi:parvulin-like peptidyl-prolyl isomerase
VIKPVPVVLVVLAASAGLFTAACGAGQKVPGDAVAVVNGTEISRSDLDGWLGQVKKSYESQKQQFPKVGTPEYQQLQSYWVNYLVQQAEFEQAAKELGIKVTEKDVDKGVEDSIKSKFDGSRTKFERALADQGFPESKYRQIIRVSVLGQKIFDQVTKNATVAAQETPAYYRQNISTYQQKSSRLVQYIVIKKMQANGQIDFPRSKTVAFQIWRRLKAGANFAALAKKYSADKQSASEGGKVTFQRGQTVSEFDKVAFALDTGALSTPVKSTTYGYFIIRALSKVKPEHTTPFPKVANEIRATLLQQKKQQAMLQWEQDLSKKYKSKVSYATGFAPPTAATSPSTTTSTQ